MSLDTISILDGNTFVTSDRRGDIEATPVNPTGLFTSDTRFLSRWVLTIDGQRPTVLSVDEQAYYKVQFFMALSSGTVYVDSQLSVIRQRAVQDGFRETITLANHGKEPVRLKLKLEADCDFADLFEVKDKQSKKGQQYRVVQNGRLVLGYVRDTFRRETWISCADGSPRITEDGIEFDLTIEPHATWNAHLDVSAVVQPGRQGKLKSKYAEGGAVVRAVHDQGVADWIAQAPKLSSAWEPLGLTYRRSLVDLAALRFRTALTSGGLPAAGLPWFMAAFGRDSLITSLQAVPFVPELAATTLRILALFQAHVDDAFRDAEPGKILHELRLGELTAFEERPHSPYYGAADSTPLYLVLLEEYARWSGDRELVQSLEPVARAAIEWIDRYGDRDGDGYVEYERRNAETGLENQCWKDSGDSIAFADGTLAPTPRATCEIQGYVYDAKRRTARLAREVWNDARWAEQLEREAEALKQRFNRDYWIPERGFFALALDGQKRKVDSLTSNIGHLLWSGIADPDKAASCVRHLMSDALFSGWGIRTMAVGEGSYNPIGYHVGTVWPHDTSLIAWGLRQYGYREEAARLALVMLEAAALFHHRLPEAFGGYPRELTDFPVEYPTACSPQAWATAAPLLLVRALLGLESDGKNLIVDPVIPREIGRIELLDIPGRWGKMDAFGRARVAA